MKIQAIKRYSWPLTNSKSATHSRGCDWRHGCWVACWQNGAHSRWTWRFSPLNRMQFFRIYRQNIRRQRQKHGQRTGYVFNACITANEHVCIQLHLLKAVNQNKNRNRPLLWHLLTLVLDPHCRSNNFLHLGKRRHSDKALRHFAWELCGASLGWTCFPKTTKDII
jgi:hypothetical protein